ncbi:MAG: methyltransferase [Gammaproteobacteria bacterium]|nr:methyltransferase [Gammaproteobacteria bacterium]NND61059.1 class I SAM-dependent methyltransferase [Gammaproteobacteria bacterium]
MKKILLGCATVMVSMGVAIAAHHGSQSIEAQLTRAAVGDHRSDKHIARNVYRHPAETLAFFGLQPDMTVVEISPGGSGWYTEILAPVLREHGRYVAGSYDPQSGSDYYRRNAARYLDKLAAAPEIYSEVEVAIFEPPDKLDTVPPGTADMVLTFRNTHNWMRRGQAEAAYQAFYRMLRDGGTLGVVQHRAPAGSTTDPGRGYLTEAEVIAVAEKAGFRLDARSEVNANPEDTADHPEGVWTLPPSLRLGETDREKYQAIGESDRMTLRFVK